MKVNFTRRGISEDHENMARDILNMLSVILSFSGHENFLVFYGLFKLRLRSHMLYIYYMKAQVNSVLRQVLLSNCRQNNLA